MLMGRRRTVIVTMLLENSLDELAGLAYAGLGEKSCGGQLLTKLIAANLDTAARPDPDQQTKKTSGEIFLQICADRKGFKVQAESFDQQMLLD